MFATNESVDLAGWRSGPLGKETATLVKPASWTSGSTRCQRPCVTGGGGDQHEATSMHACSSAVSVRRPVTQLSR
jgi:hypothetical protein